jgi:hypothetical protein
MARKKPSGGGDAAVRIEGECILAGNIRLCDAELALYVSDHAEDDRVGLIERALRVGLIALRNAGVTLNVDLVGREMERLMRRVDESNERAAQALEKTLRETFADGDGRLPRTLERFLGDDGTLRRLVAELFDEERRDSAIGRMRTLLDGVFGGDGSVISRMLDPRRDDSPLHGFRAEIREALEDVSERLVRLEAARDARAEERARGTAKGGDFEDEVEAALGELLAGSGDLVEGTGRVVGDSVCCKKGDSVITIDPSRVHGQTARVAVEAKSGRYPLDKLCRELDDARRNRGAAVAVGVYRTGNAPAGCAPFTLHGEHVICEFDPVDPRDPAFAAAIRLARAIALSSARSGGELLDIAAVRRGLDGIVDQLKVIRSMKAKLSSVSTVTLEVRNALDLLRQGVLDCVAVIESHMMETAEKREVA